MNPRANLARRVRSAVNHEWLKLERRLRVCLPVGQPISAMVELCSVCNLRCPLCPAGCGELKRKRGFMEEEVFRAIVDQLDDVYTRDFIPAMWGESLLHPRFIEFMRYARRKTWRISLSTNGNPPRTDAAFRRDLVGTGIDEIVCAVDGHDQEAYSTYRRGGSLEKVHAFLRGLREARDAAGATRPRLVAQVHLFRFNEKHLDEIRSQVGPYVDDVWTKRTRTFYTDASKVEDLRALYGDLKPEDRTNQFPAEGRPACASMLLYANINWEGDVLACCKDPENILRFGNIRERPFREIRRSRRFRRAAQKLLKSQYEDEVCRRCFIY